MRKLLALFVLICVFFPLAVTAMSLTSIRPWLLDRSFYERVVSDERIYEAAFIWELPNRFNSEILADANQLPVAAVNIALREVVTPDYLRQQSVNAVNDFFDFIEGRDGNMEIGFDTVPLKVALMGESRAQFAAALAGALPSCRPGQEPIAPEGKLTRCITEDTSVNEAAAQITRALPAVLENTPDLIVLNDPVNFRQSWRSLDWFLGSAIRFGLDLSILTVVFITALVGLAGAYLGGNDLRERLQWSAASLLLPGLLFVLMGLTLAMPWIADMLHNRAVYVNWGGIEYSEAFRQAMLDLTVYIVERIGSGFLITGVVSSLIALAIIVWSLKVAPSEQRTGKIVQIPVHNT